MANDPGSIKAFIAECETIAPTLLASDPKRRVYTILRECFIKTFGGSLGSIFDAKSPGRTSKLAQSRKTFEEIVSWLSPPYQPLTTEEALKIVNSDVSPAWRDVIFGLIGKHPRRGQPASKRHLAVYALDLKCARPTLTLRKATDVLCPCGKAAGQHTDKCREQLRQQINRLITFLKTLGYDFTWERIGTDGWKEKIE